MHLMSGRTAFDIALRLSTIRQSDQVLVVYNRRIIERGTHESLFTVRASTTTSMGASTGRCSIPYEMGTGFRHWQRNFKTALSLKSSYLCHRGRE